MSESLVVRPIEDRDWDRVFEIFRAVVAEGETYAYPESLTSDAARALWVEGLPGESVVALRDGSILGTPNLVRIVRREVRTWRRPVLWSRPRRGIGRWAGPVRVRNNVGEDQGYAAMQFNAVVSTNVHAIELYRKLGFVTIGTVPEAFDHAKLGRVGLDIMYLKL